VYTENTKAAAQPQKEHSMAVAQKQESIEIPAIKLKTFVITLEGDSPLVCHAWSSKAKREMLDKQMKKAKVAREAKDPYRDFCESLYWVSKKPAKPTPEDVKKATFGFPTIAFKSAAVDACSHVGEITKVEARGAFHINGDMLEIKGTPELREDMVRVGMGTADIRYRGEFKSWSVTFEVRCNANVLSPEQIINLFNTAGFAIGVGEHRPQKDGSWGMFHVKIDK
jgi:hypothetical protein